MKEITEEFVVPKSGEFSQIEAAFKEYMEAKKSFDGFSLPPEEVAPVSVSSDEDLKKYRKAQEARALAQSRRAALAQNMSDVYDKLVNSIPLWDVSFNLKYNQKSYAVQKLKDAFEKPALNVAEI